MIVLQSLRDTESPTSVVVDHNYYLYGLCLASDVPLPELDAIGAREPDCYFELLSATESPPRSDFIHQTYLPHGKPWRSCAKIEHGYLLRFHNLADFEILHGAERIRCSPIPNVPDHTIRHLLLDQVIPVSLNVRGMEAIHASAVVTAHGACGFLGQTGSGKSTLVASLVANGNLLLGDDCLPLTEIDGNFFAIPSYPGVRLWPESAKTLLGESEDCHRVSHYNEKRRAMLGNSWDAEPSCLKALFVLTKPSSQPNSQGVIIERMPSLEALRELLQQSFRFDITDRNMLARQFLFFGRLIERVPVFRLIYPRDYSSLPQVREAIAGVLERHGASRRF